MSAAASVRQFAKGHTTLIIRRFALAALSVLVGLAIQLALDPSPSLVIPLLISLLAVIVASTIAGRSPALFATIANLLLDCYFFAPPRFSFVVADPADVWLLAAFVAAGTAVSLLSHRLSGTRRLPRLALLLASSLFLMVVALLLWFDFANFREAEVSVEHTYQVLNASQSLFSTIQDADSRQRGYLLTGEQQYLDLFQQLTSAEPARMQQLRDLTDDNALQQKRLADLQRVLDARVAQLEQGISARRIQGIPAAIEAVRAEESAHLMGNIRSTLEAINTEEHRLLSRRSRASAAEAARTVGALATGTALLVALLIFAGVVIESDVGKLEASERMLRRQADLLNKAPGPIIAWRLGGEIEYWNHGAEELFGFSPQQAVGRLHDELLRPLGISAIEDLLARDGEWSGELRHIVDQREIVVESRMTVVTEPDGRKTVLQTNRDITREKQAHEEIQRLNRDLEQRVRERTAQLEASNQELEAFAYSVSHDLRAPLRGIDGWSLALLEDYGRTFDQKARQYLERVRAETQRMGHLIDDLLRLSRLTRVEMQRESVDLTSLARAIASRLREAEPNRSLDFVVQEGLIAGGDAHLLEIVVSNLLSNSVKFTGPRARARIEFGHTKYLDEPAFFVRDNGVGFDMAHAGMLFVAFQRLHRYDEFPGNGIGLATAHQVLRRHGGRIWADARPNQGATFYFTIGTEANRLPEPAGRPILDVGL